LSRSKKERKEGKKKKGKKKERKEKRRKGKKKERKMVQSARLLHNADFSLVPFAPVETALLPLAQRARAARSISNTKESLQRARHRADSRREKRTKCTTP